MQHHSRVPWVGMNESNPNNRFVGRGVSGAVLAGGGSRRFGRDKAHAVLGGKSLIEHVLNVMRGFFEDILIVTNQPVLFECFDVTVVSDIVRGPGALAGLLTALLHAENDRCFVAACDMPFLNASVVRRILRKEETYDVVLPLVENEPQPLHAVYSKKCIPFIQKGISQKDFRIVDFYPGVSVLRLEETTWRDIDPDRLSFFNINTRDEFHRAEGLLKKKSLAQS